MYVELYVVGKVWRLGAEGFLFGRTCWILEACDWYLCIPRTVGVACGTLEGVILTGSCLGSSSFRSIALMAVLRRI